MKKLKLGFWEIWNMSFGFLGIQMGFALQNANVSRIFQTLGARIDDIPILWVAASLRALIVQFFTGYFSYQTWIKLGRRRPYFLVGALLTSVTLFILPNSPILWFVAGMLWFMDASILEPSFFNNQPIYSLAIGGCAMILAGLLSLRVDDKDTLIINET